MLKWWPWHICATRSRFVYIWTVSGASLELSGEQNPLVDILWYWTSLGRCDFVKILFFSKIQNSRSEEDAQYSTDRKYSKRASPSHKTIDSIRTCNLRSFFMLFIFVRHNSDISIEYIELYDARFDAKDDRIIDISEHSFCHTYTKNAGVRAHRLHKEFRTLLLFIFLILFAVQCTCTPIVSSHCSRSNRDVCVRVWCAKVDGIDCASAYLLSFYSLIWDI